MTGADTTDRMRDLAGLSVVPGTLNVHLQEPFDRSLTSRYVAAEEIGPEWQAKTGQAGYFVVPVLVAGRYRCLAFQADEPGYPTDLIELIGEVHLRSALGLTDGEAITFSVLGDD